MDSVTASSRREALREKIDEAQAALRQTAMAARFKDDPLSEHLNALALCVGALGDIYQASEDTQLDIAETLKSQTDVVTKEAIARVEASGAELAMKIGPQIAAEAKWTMRQEYKILRMRTIIVLAAILCVVIAVPSAFTYAAGLNLGMAQGEDAAHAIQIAMTYSPEAAVIWGKLMTYNNPVPAMALCRKNIAVDAQGRRSCSLPVWIDPIPGTSP